MRTSVVMIFLQFLSIAFSAEFNKSCPTLHISYKNFKDNEIFEVEDYGYDMYIEASFGIINEETFANVPRILRFMVFNSNFTSFDFTSLYRMTYLESVDMMAVTGLPVLSNNLMLGFKSLRRLSFYDTDVKFEHNSFQNLIHLDYLSIAKADVSILGNEVFTGSRLRELYWTHSGVEKIEKYCFSPLRHIEIINLNGNKLESLSPELFLGLKHLERLYLKRNKLTAINFKFFEFLPNLRYLDISRNNISRIDIREVRRSLPNLTTIILDEKNVISGQNVDSDGHLDVILI